MSKYQDSVLTPAGLLLASKAYAGKTTFKLTRTATTADVLTTDGIKKLTMLPNEVQAGTIAQSDNVVSDDHTLITTELLFTNQDLAKSYQINAIGVYAMEAGTTNEILYSVAIADQAEFMPDFADKVLMEFKTIITMAVGQKSNVTIEMVANNLATQQYVQNAIKDLAQDADVVHDNHDGTIKVNETNFQPVATDGSSKVILPATGTSQTAYDLSNFQQPPITKTDGTATVVVEKGESVALKLWPLAEGLYTLQIKAGAIFTTAPEGYNRTLWWGVTFLSNDRDYFGTIRIWRRQEKGLIPYYMENIVINQEYSGTQMYWSERMKEDLSQPTDYLTFVQMPDVRAMQSVALTDRFGNPFYIDDWGSIKKFMVGLSTQFAAHSRFVVLTAKTDDFPGNENASGWITINYFGSSDQGDFSVDVTGVSGTRYEATFKNGVLSGSWRVSKFSSEIIKPTISCNTCTTGTAKNFIEYEIRENILYLNMEVWPVGYGGNTSILVSYLGGMFNSSLAGVNGRAMAYNQLGANSSTYGAVQAPLTIDNGILRIATSGYTFSNGTTSNINGSFQYQGPIASLDFTTGFTAWH